VLSIKVELNILMLEIKTKKAVKGITIIDLDKLQYDYKKFALKEEWYKLIIPCSRHNIIDILINGESIKHRLNSGLTTPHGYQIWIHGNLANMFSRLSQCIAEDDLLIFKNLEEKYLICESWNEYVDGEFIPSSVEQFFANGEGPFWYHRDNWHNLPYTHYDGETTTTDISVDEDLIYEDVRFYGSGMCRSSKINPTLPTMRVDDIKSQSLRELMEKFGFTEILQIQQITMQPNSVLPVHRDDFTYETSKNIISGPSQLYFVLSGDKDKIKLKFKNVGLLNVDRPIFINNRGFVHSLVYTGNEPRTVLLAYGVSSFTNKKFL
jgi:hypothetical protein